jgi:hypothetical protein
MVAGGVHETEPCSIVQEMLPEVPSGVIHSTPWWALMVAGGMHEAMARRAVVEGASVEHFGLLLRYLYSGAVTLEEWSLVPGG